MSTKQINHVNVFQTSKVLAAMTFVMMVIWLMFVMFVGLFTGKNLWNGFGDFMIMAIAMLVFVPFFTFLMHAAMFWFYNLVAHRVGGIEVQLKDSNEEKTI